MQEKDSIANKVFISILVSVAPLMAICLPARTLDYWQAWGLIGILFTLNVLTYIYLRAKNPKLLERRMHAGPIREERPKQKLIMSAITVMFFAMLWCAGSERGHKAIKMPDACVFMGYALLIFSYYIFFLVFKVNSFAASTIVKSEGQKLVSGGLYAYIRHPMYVGVVLLLIAIPMALASKWACAAGLITMPLFAARIEDEELFLVAHLEGYEEYRKRVRYRLFPGIW